MFNFRANTEKHKLKQQDATSHPLTYKELVNLNSPSSAMNLWKFWEVLAGGLVGVCHCLITIILCTHRLCLPSSYSLTRTVGALST